MKYIFRWKRRFFWNKKIVVGHRYEKESDKMVIYFENGGLMEISKWTLCEAKLGPDWVIAQKKSLEAQAGTAIPLQI